MKIVGAVSRVSGRASALAERVARHSADVSGQIAEVLHEQVGLCLWTLRRPEESRNSFVSAISTDGQDRFWLAGDGLHPSECMESVVSDVHAAAVELINGAEGEFLGVRSDSTGTLTLYPDSFGLCWCHVRRLPDATVFASDFSALCRLDGPRPSVDRESLFLELAIGFCPDNRTVFDDVQVVPPGSETVLDSGATQVRRRLQLHYGDRWFGASDEVKFEILDGLFQRMGERIARLAGGPVAISLSAGYDSRYALAILRDMHRVGALLTFGDPESEEVLDAHAIALRHAQSAHWENFPIPETQWAEWRHMVQSLGNAGIVQWCGWADRWLGFVRQRADACVIGYLGDALSGKRLDLLNRASMTNELDTPPSPWARGWMGWELDMGEWACSPLLRPEARSALLRIVTQRFSSLLDDATFSNDHQTALHLNLFGRQRRWVGTQPVLISARLRPLCFFVDREYRQFWMNVPARDLQGQSLYLRYAQSRFPRLFPPPPGMVARVGTRIRNGISHALTAGAKKQPRKPPPIRRLDLLKPHYARILEEHEATTSWFDEIVDFGALRAAILAYLEGRDDPRLTTAMLFRYINVMHLLALRSGRA